MGEPAVSDLGVVSIIEDPATEEGPGIAFSLHFDSIADFPNEPKDGERDEVIKEKGKGAEEEIVLMEIFEVFREGLLLDAGSREIVVEGVVVVDDFGFSVHSRSILRCLKNGGNLNGVC